MLSGAIFLLLLSSVSAELLFSSEGYGCSICLATVDEILSNQSPSIKDACAKFFPKSNCDELFVEGACIYSVIIYIKYVKLYIQIILRVELEFDTGE